MDEKQQLIQLTEVNEKLINDIKLSLAIFLKLNNFTHNNINTFLNEILPSSEQRSL